MILTTERLILRPFSASDFEDVHSYASDPAVTRYTSFGPNSPEDTREFLARCEANAASTDEVYRNYNFAISLRESGRVIGGTGFAIDHPAHRGAELGYVLGQDHWGAGIATEAVTAVITFA